MVKADSKYREIYRDMRERISAGDFEPGERLPAQQALASSYGVTLMTLRQALAALADDGLVTAERGRGTFVAPRLVQYRLNHLGSFAQEMDRQGKSLTTRVVAAGLTLAPDPGYGPRLGVPPGAELLAIERVRLIDGRPVVHQRSYMPSRFHPQVTQAELGSRSLYDVLREDFGLEIARAVETLRPVILDDYEARQLLQHAGSPALLSERLSLAEGDVPVILDEAYLPGDAVVVTTERVAERTHLTYRVL